MCLYIYIYIYIVVIAIVILFGGVLSSLPLIYMKFSRITIYGSNVPAKPLSC